MKMLLIIPQNKAKKPIDVRLKLGTGFWYEYPKKGKVETGWHRLRKSGIRMNAFGMDEFLRLRM